MYFVRDYKRDKTTYTDLYDPTFYHLLGVGLTQNSVSSLLF